jgi:hypothetical protein
VGQESAEGKFRIKTVGKSMKITGWGLRTKEQLYEFLDGFYIFLGRDSPQWTRAPSLSTLHDHTQTHHCR